MASLAASPLSQHLNSTPAESTPRPSRHWHSPTASPSQTQSHSATGSSPQSISPRPVGGSVMDVDTLIRSNGGDLRKALDALVVERNSLQSQNTQLWKLIEKQRSQAAHLVSDNDRLRSDRERANTRLTAAGLEPIGGRKIQNSSSAVGLGLRAVELPQIRRHNSDRDDTIKAAPTLQVPSESTGSSNVSSTSTASSPKSIRGTPTLAPTGLLPSPMNENKSRRESRMAFPPEVSTFMSLADSPREPIYPVADATVKPSSSFNTLSPASQYSVSPSGNGRDEADLVPPPSSRILASTIEVPEPDVESPQYPPTRSSSTDSPPPSYRHPEGSESPRASEDFDTPRASVERPLGPLHRLSPSLLAHTRLTIPTSTVKSNQTGRDVLCFVVSVTVRPPSSPPNTWSVSKLFSAFIDLDTRIKGKAGKSRKEWKALVAPLPEGRSWKDFAPSKIDQRKAALEAYLQSLLVAPLSDKTDLCEFLSSDHLQLQESGAKKEGYLTKKGKNFGGWKTRFFVVEGPTMEYYESRGGTHLGSIVITGAQIGRQNRPSESSEEHDFRHAFLIIETARKGAQTRHVLCAESDLERDSWIEVLVRHVDPELAPKQVSVQRHRSNSRKSSKDVVVTSALPLSSMPSSDSKFSGAPSPSLINSLESKRATQASIPTHLSTPSITSQSSLPLDSETSETPSKPAQSQPRTLITSPSADNPKLAEPIPVSRAAKRQSMMPSRQTHTAAYLTKLSNEGMSAPPGYEAKERDRKAKSGRFWPSFGKAPEKVGKPVFGVPVADSIAIASVGNLPAIVFRCIEYLEAKHAEEEEGIYRLSGSSAVIKGLKERFDVDGDVNLRAIDDHWDPHAIAGLLKTYLRELPASLLTRELHPRFLAVMDLIESSARVSELSRLVSELPPPNYALLRALTAHLILIVRNASLNKMTLRNIGIVFSPTLGIPAGIFSELVSHFGAIFDDELESEDAATGVVEINALEVPADTGPEGALTVGGKNRNSMLYQAGGVDTLLGLGGRSLDSGESLTDVRWSFTL
ncbi:hypothetical protein BCR39DRAFT_474567 [Naematelia encephala]|uniref:RhoGAP-domain-containing protein n=1 Tax=Naematelia encephala TaxID=71784 RepID=A0A1Y2AH82_9TREE|nr:hypothetical protein BCR39DRAFT_474567 [Naematelia encephala]